MPSLAKQIKWGLLALGMFSPGFALAALTSDKTFGEVLQEFTDFLSKDLLFVVVGLALVVFFFGVALYVLRSGDTKSLEQARNILIWGTIGIAVIFSIGGIVRLLQNTLKANNQNLPKVNESDYRIDSGYPQR